HEPDRAAALPQPEAGVGGQLAVKAHRIDPAPRHPGPRRGVEVRADPGAEIHELDPRARGLGSPQPLAVPVPEGVLTGLAGLEQAAERGIEETGVRGQAAEAEPGSGPL